VNRYQVREELRPDLLRVNPEVGERQIRRLYALRGRRDNISVSTSLSLLERGARSDDNLLPLILNCVEKDATLGEICGVLRGVFGEYQAHTSF
jgi:methylmalonyl-CoA mutase N-terminal domain/subunit